MNAKPATTPPNIPPALRALIEIVARRAVQTLRERDKPLQLPTKAA
jgi:hypothetical protein